MDRPDHHPVLLLRLRRREQLGWKQLGRKQLGRLRMRQLRLRRVRRLRRLQRRVQLRL